MHFTSNPKRWRRRRRRRRQKKRRRERGRRRRRRRKDVKQRMSSSVFIRRVQGRCRDREQEMGSAWTSKCVFYLVPVPNVGRMGASRSVRRRPPAGHLPFPRPWVNEHGRDTLWQGIKSDRNMQSFSLKVCHHLLLIPQGTSMWGEKQWKHSINGVSLPCLNNWTKTKSLFTRENGNFT